MDYKEIEGKIYNWTFSQDDVQALVVIGSRARKNHPADEWSDLDLILFVNDPPIYSTDSGWLAQFGNIWLLSHNMTGIGDAEWLVVFEDGIKVDFLLAPVSGSLSEMLFGSKFHFVTRRGVRVLINKLEEAELHGFQEERVFDWQKPDEIEFKNTLNQFWLDAYKAAIMLKRAEIWRAKTIIDCNLRRNLLRFLQWQARSMHDDRYDVWHDGRFLPEWNDPQIQAVLPHLFSLYELNGTKTAFLQLLGLVDQLGKETADRWGYHYPATPIDNVHRWIVTVLSG